MNKFSLADIGVTNAMKSSVYRGIRQALLDQHPAFADVADEVLPKKADALLGKGANHTQFLIIDNEILFFCERDGTWLPTLKLVHRCVCIALCVSWARGSSRFRQFRQSCRTCKLTRVPSSLCCRARTSCVAASRRPAQRWTPSCLRALLA